MGQRKKMKMKRKMERERNVIANTKSVTVLHDRRKGSLYAVSRACTNESLERADMKHVKWAESFCEMSVQIARAIASN